MKFETILNLVGSDYAHNSPLANKAMFVFDHKDRKLTSLNFYDGYSITENSKKELKRFCEKTDEEKVRYFIIYIFIDSICVYDDHKSFKLKLDRAS